MVVLNTMVTHSRITTLFHPKFGTAEFRAFVEQTEIELWRLFKSIDKDHDGRLDRDELRQAFQSAHIAIDSANLDSFFDKIDTNHDGVISFDEWRLVAFQGLNIF